MIRYVLKRCKIALREKKSWFYFSVAGPVIYMAYIFLFPSGYVMTAYVNFNIDDSERIISMPSRSVWRQINSLIGSEERFVQTNAMKMPPELQEKIIKVFIAGEYLRPGSYDERNLKPAMMVQAVAQRLISINADSTVRKYFVTYRGDDYSLGIELTNYYCSRLVEYLFDSVTRYMERVSPDDVPGSPSGRRKAGLKAEAERPDEKNPLTGHERDIYKFIMERISTVYKSEIKILSGVEFTAVGIVIRIILSLIVSFFLAAIIIIIAEFSGKSLSSEVQAARYLEAHILGSMGEIKSLKN